jgi:hypothetical protein
MVVEYPFPFNPEDLRHLYQGEAARLTKRQLIKSGFKHQISLYGVLTDQTTGTSVSRRIEVFSDQPYTERLVMLVHQFFQELKPLKPYTLWTLRSRETEITQVGAYV